MKVISCEKPHPSRETKRRIRMRKPVDAIRLLNSVVNALINDEMETDKARAIIYAASTMAKIFEVAELEERVANLEQRTQKK